MLGSRFWRLSPPRARLSWTAWWPYEQHHAACARSSQATCHKASRTKFSVTLSDRRHVRSLTVLYTLLLYCLAGYTCCMCYPVCSTASGRAGHSHALGTHFECSCYTAFSTASVQDWLQEDQLQLLQRLVGPSITSILVSPDFAPHLHILPDLHQVVLDLDSAKPCGSNELCENVLQGADLGSLASLRTLKVIGEGVDPDDYAIEQLRVLTQLEALHLHSIFVVPDTGLHHASVLPQLTRMELHLDSWGYDSAYANRLLWLLEDCNGHLKQLFLGAGYMDMAGQIGCAPCRACTS